MHRYAGLRCAACKQPICPEEENKTAIDYVYCPACSRDLLEEHPFTTQSDFREKPTDDVYHGKIFIGTMWRRGEKYHAHPISGQDKEFAKVVDARNFLYTTSLSTWFIS